MTLDITKKDVFEIYTNTSNSIKELANIYKISTFAVKQIKKHRKEFKLIKKC